METPNSTFGSDSRYSTSILPYTAADLQEGGVIRLCFAEEKWREAGPPSKKRRETQGSDRHELTLDCVCERHERYNTWKTRRKEYLDKSFQSSVGILTTFCETPSCVRLAEVEMSLGHEKWVSLCSLCGKAVSSRCSEEIRTSQDGHSLTQRDEPEVASSFTEIMKGHKAFPSTHQKVQSPTIASVRSRLPTTPASRAHSYLTPIPTLKSQTPASLETQHYNQSISLLSSTRCQNPACEYVGSDLQCLSIIGHGLMSLCPRCYKSSQSRPIGSSQVSKESSVKQSVHSTHPTFRHQSSCCSPCCGETYRNFAGHKFMSLCGRCIRDSCKKSMKMSQEEYPQTRPKQEEAHNSLQPCEFPGCDNEEEYLSVVDFKDSEGMRCICSSCVDMLVRKGFLAEM